MQEALIAKLLENLSLTALVSNRIFWNELPQGSSYPAILLTRISGVSDYKMSGATGLVASRIQIDCYDDVYASAVAVARVVKKALSGVSFEHLGIKFQGIFSINERNSFDKPPQGSDKMHRVSMDFNIWHDDVSV